MLKTSTIIAGFLIARYLTSHFRITLEEGKKRAPELA